MNMMKEDFVVTPWEVKGNVDYERLIKRFGTERITEELLKRIEKHTGTLHYMLRRGVFFTHRDMNWLLDEYEKGNKFYLYTGRGPSGNTHIGHLVPWIFTKWLQDKFKTKLIFQLTDDEKFLFKENLELEDTHNYAMENMLDIIAMGFKPEKTKIFINTDYSKTLYKQALRVAKKITFSTTKAAFGFDNSTNIGSIFYTSMQAVPAFLESVEKGKNVPCLIPHAVDQDPHFRVTRDILPKLGYYKPASIQNIFLPGLKEGGKMDASDPDSTIYTTDSEKDVKRKMAKAFSGGRETVELHRKYGGNPDVDMPFQFMRMVFEPDDKKLAELYKGYKNGDILSGEMKSIATEKVNTFLKKHQLERERARKNIDKYILKD